MGGLWEVNPNIEQQKFNFNVIKDFTGKLNLEIRKDTLSNTEWDLLVERGSTRLADEEWLFKGINKNFV